MSELLCALCLVVLRSSSGDTVTSGVVLSFGTNPEKPGKSNVLRFSMYLLLCTQRCICIYSRYNAMVRTGDNFIV